MRSHKRGATVQAIPVPSAGLPYRIFLPPTGQQQPPAQAEINEPHGGTLRTIKEHLGNGWADQAQAAGYLNSASSSRIADPLLARAAAPLRLKAPPRAASVRQEASSPRMLRRRLVERSTIFVRGFVRQRRRIHRQSARLLRNHLSSCLQTARNRRRSAHRRLFPRGSAFLRQELAHADSSRRPCRFP